MTGRLGNVDSVTRVDVGGVPTVVVKVDLGDELLTSEHLDSAGVDALPLPGDECMVEECEGLEATSVNAYADPKNLGKAEPGERRTYARDAAGEVVCEVWCKGDGTIALKSIKSGSKIDLNGVLIDQQGNITTPGDVKALAGTPEVPLPGVTLSGHLHGSGVGPTTSPTPGT
jgi:hypothetical protein